MSKNRNRKADSSKKKEEYNRSRKESRNTTALKTETWHSVYAVIAFVLALFFILSAFESAGPAGVLLFNTFKELLGVGYFLFPLILILLGISLIGNNRPKIALPHLIGSLLFLLSSLGMIEIASSYQRTGGILGFIVAYPFLKFFGTYVSIIILVGIFIIGLVIILEEHFNPQEFIAKIRQFFIKIFTQKKNAESTPESIAEEQIISPPEETEEIPITKNELKKTKDEALETIPFEAENRTTRKEKTFQIPHSLGKYTPPPLSLLEQDRGKPNTGDIKANANIIKRTLANFGIDVEMDEITTGPTVTRYSLKPAEGVKLSRIVGLQNDLGLALAAHPIRIEAPIPGKSLVGIEVPNRAKSIVGLATLLSDEEFVSGANPLLVALGRGISGRAKFGNLAKMPHVLIAGATGAGKSVTIHAIITSLLYRNGPDDLKFIMIDPKRVELTLYNSIPHLLTPVITEAKKSILALKWATKEMDRRYDVLQSHSVRDIKSYHTNIYAKQKDTNAEIELMPYIVIVIDELADIMQTYPRELESAIVRLAQMSRAVGIHLILSTQRPSVNVITGLIKANVPSRVALQVASQIDSRTILDQSGAEKLLGAGDMLYLSGEMAQPERLQSAYISEEEVKRVVKYLGQMYKDEINSEVDLTGPVTSGNTIFSSMIESNDADDDLYEEARQIVIETRKASTSFLQRKLGIGYARAARLIDILEEHGVVGPGNGAKPREVLEESVHNIENDHQQNS